MLMWILYVAIAVYLLKKLAKRSNSVACLIGKTAIVTGGNSGLGYALSVLLASRGCRVIIADIADATTTSRQIQKLTGNKNIFSKYLNLASLKSIREFSQDIKKTEEKIDILINNAGVGCVKQVESEDGLNTTLQINYFGAFLLTHLLIEPLKKAGSSRVIFVASVAAFLHNLTLENLNSLSPADNIKKIITQYANSKLLNILAAQEFGRKLKIHGINVNSADPWAARTPIFEKTHGDMLSRVVMHILPLLGQGPFLGAQTVFHAASSELLDDVTGEHFFRCRRFFKPRVLKDVDFCKKIWEQSEELVKLKSEERIEEIAISVM